MWPRTALLDRIVTREIARAQRTGWGSRCGGRYGCGCARCSGGRRAAADEAAAARGATRAGTGGSALPLWRGWTPPVPLSLLIDPGGHRIASDWPTELAPFFRTGRPAIYRITRAGIDRARPLYIGMVELNVPVAERVRRHFRTSRGDPRVRQAIQNLQPGQILVQAAQLGGVFTVANAHVYEGWLAARERPLIYNSSKRTFDEASDVH